jgi:membrane-bound lytic murein transglycosylase A
VSWSVLLGWTEERPAEAWPALILSCGKLASRDPQWRDVCADADLFPQPDDDTARAFFENRFTPYELGGGETGDGLITGYYEPLLHGNFAKTVRYRYPLYRPPDDLVIVDLGELYPELEGKRVRGRLTGRRVIPYYSRAEIHDGRRPLKGRELAWVDDPVALFFLHIQGSGRMQLPDGRVRHVGYADQNGHPYVAIGRRLVDMGALRLEDVSLQTIRAWLKAHPRLAEAVLNSNPSYVFFDWRESTLSGPVGSFNVPLSPERSVAVDPRHVPLGFPLWLDTTLPAVVDSVTYRRLVFAQDTGGAIKGSARADVFFGYGEQAEQLAGHMKQPGRLYLLRPTSPAVEPH